MREIVLGLLALLLVPLWPAGNVDAATGLVAAGASRTVTARPGEQVTYEVRFSATGASPEGRLALSGYLPAGFAYVPGSTTVNGEAALDPEVQDSMLQWSNLPAPGNQPLRLGMNTLVQDNMDKAHIAKQFRWTRALTGPGGYVRQLVYPVVASTSGALPTWKDFENLAYDHDLTPVVRLQGYFNPRAGYWDKPEQDPDGGYATVAQAIRRVVADLPRRDGHLLYLEIWNEPNLNADWGGAADPVEYARFLLAAGQAIRSLADPHLVIMNGGLAPGGDYPHLEYLDAMFKAVPAAAYAFDVWASHPYAGVVTEVKVEPLVVTSLERAGVISGRVILEGRRTGSGASVSLGSDRAWTAADGSFHLAVPAGCYTVAVTAPGYLEERWEEVCATSGTRTLLPEGLMVRGRWLDPSMYP